jgi:integrase/recombinase XerD
MTRPFPLSDERERSVVRLWRCGHLSEGSIRLYLRWIRRFHRHCQQRQLIERDHLTLTGVKRFTTDYVGPRIKRRLASGSRNTARNALHAWSCALQALGTSLKPWREKTAPLPLSPLLTEYRQYRRSHNGVTEGTLKRDLTTANAFLAKLRQRRKATGKRKTTVADIDAFVHDLSMRVSKRTVADTCSSLRAFLRFLETTDRLHQDLSKNVPAPRIRFLERPPRALPWTDVRRILRSIRQSEPPGKRDFAMLLMMATYGLGAAEVLGLRLEDLDWHGRILRVRRPKTAALIELPLLPQVARAVTAYIKGERPPTAEIRQIFLRANMPYEPLTNGAIRHRIRYYAQQCGISARVIGAHAFRHSHATRQVDAGANLKVVSDILGHRRSSSTSVYVRVALHRLRMVGLPVPR